KLCIEAGALLAAVSKSMIRGIASNGSRRSQKPASAAERRSCMSSWMDCVPYGTKHGARCCASAASTRPRNGSCKCRLSVRSVPPCLERWCRLPIASAASASSGPIVAWGLRPMTAHNIVMSADDCSVPRNRNTWLEYKSQSSDERDLQEYGHQRHSWCGTIPRFLREIVGQRHGARDGSAHAGPQNRGNHFDNLEERRKFRRESTDRASSLSAVSETRPISGPLQPGGGQSVLTMLGFEGEYRDRE